MRRCKSNRSRRGICAVGCRRAVRPKPGLIVRFGLDGRLHTLPRFAQFTGEGLTSPNAAGTGTRFPAVSLRKVAPPNDLRERPYLHDLLRIDPPLHHDLHAKRIIGFHYDSSRRRGRNLHVITGVVAEQYDLMVGNAEIDAAIRSLTASAKLTQPLVRYDEILQHRHRKYGTELPLRPYA
jgi:hypothetical protein